MKLAIISPFPPYRGGISKETEILYNSLKKKHNVCVYNFKRLYPDFFFPGKSQFDYNLSSLKSIKSIDSINFFSWHKTATLINKENYDKVIFRFWHPFLSVIYSYIISKIKRYNKDIEFICICDNVYPHERFIFDKFLLKIFFKKIDNFITMSTITTNQIMNLVPGANINETFLPIKDSFGEKISKIKASTKLNIEHQKFTILFFGLIRSYKGLDVALNAIKQLVKKNRKFKFLIAGECYEDKNKYIKIINKNNLNDYVVWHDKYINDSEVYLYFSASDLVLLPYKETTQSGIIPIAYNFNMPVVSSNLPGLQKYIENQKTGYLFNPDDCNSLAMLLNDIIISNDIKKIESYIKSYKNKYSVEKLNKLIEKIINEK